MCVAVLPANHARRKSCVGCVPFVHLLVQPTTFVRTPHSTLRVLVVYKPASLVIVTIASSPWVITLCSIYSWYLILRSRDSMGSASDAIAWDAVTCMLNAIGLAKSRLQHLPTPKDNTQMKQAIDRLMDVLSQKICDIDTSRHARAMCINQDNIYTFLP